MDKWNLDEHMDLFIGSDNYWCYPTEEVKLCDSETLVSVNYLFGWVFSDSIVFKSEELVKTNLRWTHVLFSRDIAGYEKINSKKFCLQDADV